MLSYRATPCPVVFPTDDRFQQAILGQFKGGDVVELLAVLVATILQYVHLGHHGRLRLHHNGSVDILDHGVKLERLP